MSKEPPDLESAGRWYTRAANAGNRHGMYLLGLMHASNTPPDLGAARQLWEQAAEAGDSDAMNALADMYAKSTEPPNLPAARHWYERAAQAGHRRAVENLRSLDEASSGGWGTEPPNDDEIDGMVDWLDGPGAGAEETMDVATSAMNAIMDALRVRKISALKAATMELSHTLASRLPAVLPSPDPALNRAVQAVIHDGNELNLAVRAFADPPTPDQIAVFQDRVSDFVSALDTLGWTYERDREIIDDR
jgi:TPR repeat protein